MIARYYYITGFPYEQHRVSILKYHTGYYYVCISPGITRIERFTMLGLNVFYTYLIVRGYSGLCKKIITVFNLLNI